MNKNIEELSQRQETLEDLVKTLNENDSWDLYCIGIKLREKSIWLEELTKKTNECWELQEELKQLKENYDRIYNENCKLREEHNITDISLLDENQQLKKQKDDVVELIKKQDKIRNYYEYEECGYDEYNYDDDFKEDLLRMLGEIDE